MTTLGDLLRAAGQRGVTRLDAQLLASHHLQRDRSWVLAHADWAVPAAQQRAFVADCERLLDQVPLAYVLGEREFHGLMLQVDPSVLVPRPDTETLVDWALELLQGPLAAHPGAEVVDLGTGSGAIALAVKRRVAGARVTATDRSAEAVRVARANARAHGLEVEFVAGDWWQPLAGRRFDLCLSNPPYVAADDRHLLALRHEPASALTPGGDGLGALRQIVQGARAHLREGAWLLLEHGFDQGDAVGAMLLTAGFEPVQTRKDLAGQARCSGGQMAPADVGSTDDPGRERSVTLHKPASATSGAKR